MGCCLTHAGHERALPRMTRRPARRALRRHTCCVVCNPGNCHMLLPLAWLLVGPGAAGLRLLQQGCPPHMVLRDSCAGQGLGGLPAGGPRFITTEEKPVEEQMSSVGGPPPRNKPSTTWTSILGKYKQGRWWQTWGPRLAGASAALTHPPAPAAGSGDRSGRSLTRKKFLYIKKRTVVDGGNESRSQEITRERRSRG